ncbi:hypothetical protein JCM33374_g487 [Metschnikowia sp. JCM 33374]|nr:hypothetical protein JCM33374_g487 [Metschnikowia sp. JCM 33374]
MNFVANKDGETRQGFAQFDEHKNRILSTPDDLALTIDATRHANSDRVPITAFNKKNADHAKFVSGTFVPDVCNFPPLPVLQISLELTEKGSLRDNARIYERVKNPTLKNLIGFVTSGAFNFNVGHPTAIGLISAKSQHLEKVLVRNVGCTTYCKAKISTI